MGLFASRSSNVVVIVVTDLPLVSTAFFPCPHRTPQGLEDVSSYPVLFAELIRSGKWSAEDLKKLAGQNFLRVMREVEKVSPRRLQGWPGLAG